VIDRLALQRIERVLSPSLSDNDWIGLAVASGTTPAEVLAVLDDYSEQDRQQVTSLVEQYFDRARHHVISELEGNESVYDTSHIELELSKRLGATPFLRWDRLESLAREHARNTSGEPSVTRMAAAAAPVGSVRSSGQAEFREAPSIEMPSTPSSNWGRIAEYLEQARSVELIATRAGPISVRLWQGIRADRSNRVRVALANRGFVFEAVVAMSVPPEAIWQLVVRVLMSSQSVELIQRRRGSEAVVEVRSWAQVREDGSNSE
jgi:hypothetical protein